jgi:hypothetical protein
MNTKKTINASSVNRELNVEDIANYIFFLYYLNKITVEFFFMVC